MLEKFVGKNFRKIWRQQGKNREPKPNLKKETKSLSVNSILVLNKVVYT